MPRYLNQDTVMDKLTDESKRMLRDRVELPAAEMLQDAWAPVRDDIRAYATGVWRQLGAQDSPTTAEVAKQRITTYMDDKLRGFRGDVVRFLNDAKRQAFRQQFLVNHWIMDQVTPPNIEVKLKREPESYTPTGGVHRQVGKRPGKQWPIPGVKSKEAWFDEPIQGTANTDPVTEEPQASYEQRTDGYMKAWEIAAWSGLAIGGLQGDSPDDIDGRILGARADGNQMEDVLGRMVQTEVQVSVGDADDAFMRDHSNLVQESFWKTMEDERVCPICEHNEGKTPEKATHNMPAHPRCRCYWAKRPVEFKRLAGPNAVPGLDSRAMAIRDPRTGETLGSAVVRFDAWAQALR